MAERILITAAPGTGKSTLLEKVVSEIPQRSGFLTREIRNEDGKRVGFIAIASSGEAFQIASVTKETPFKVSRYFVDVEGFGKFLQSLSAPNGSDLLYVDEIGQMQLFSDKFKEFVKDSLSSSNDFIGTISKVYSDAFTESLKSRKDINIVEITAENRNAVSHELSELLLAQKR